MNKIIRLSIVLIVFTALLMLVGQRVFASPPQPLDVVGDPETGYAQYKLGGCVSGEVKNFKPGSKLNVALLEEWNAYPTEGLPPMPEYYWTLPGGPADIFSCVVNLKLNDSDKFVKNLPAEKGKAGVCMQTPAEKTGSIYWLDKYFNDRPIWVKVGGPFPGNSVACVPVDNSGVYAYYAPNPAGHPLPPVPGETTITQKIGTIAHPDDFITAFGPGALNLGGCVTGNIKDLPVGDKIDARLVASWPGYPDLPVGIGEFYRCVVKLEFYQENLLIDKIPVEKGNITLCFAVPPRMNGTIYMLDKYLTKEAVWVPIAGPFPTGIACGPADQTGLYGMVDRKE